MSASRCRCGDEGNVSIAALLLVVVVIGAAALVFDGAQYLVAERHASNVAEGAARAALATRAPDGPLQADRAIAAARRHAGAAGVDADSIEVSFGSDRSVTVTVVERRNRAFAVFGDDAVTVSASATGGAELEFVP